MFGNLGRRLLEGLVGLFAVLGFFYVPLGKHTGFEHARAVLSTPAAREAFADMTGAVQGLRERALDLLAGSDARAAPPAPEGPKPVPPKLKH